MSDDFFIIGVLSLVYAWVLLSVPYLILLALANIVCRLASGHFFRWVSWRTIVPLSLVTLGGWLFFYNMLKGTALFVITH
jgi:hypothetical protein